MFFGRGHVGTPRDSVVLGKPKRREAVPDARAGRALLFLYDCLADVASAHFAPCGFAYSVLGGFFVVTLRDPIGKGDGLLLSLAQVCVYMGENGVRGLATGGSRQERRDDHGDCGNATKTLYSWIKPGNR